MSAVVARIGKPHGLRGEVTVQVHTDDPEERFVPGVEFETEPDRGVLTLTTTRVHQGVWLLGFEEVHDRTGAEAVRGTRLLLEEPEDEDDAWYEEDLVGVEVRDTTGARVGEIVSLQIRPVQDLLEVRLDDGRTGLVPFVEAIVPVVEVTAAGEGHVVMDAPDGLFDLDA